MFKNSYASQNNKIANRSKKKKENSTYKKKANPNLLTAIKKKKLGAVWMGLRVTKSFKVAPKIK